MTETATPQRTTPIWRLAQSQDRPDYARGACVGEDPELFTVEGRDLRSPRRDVRYAARRRLEEAKALCGSCPIQRGCLAHSLYPRFETGVRGGLLEEERERLVPPGAKSTRRDDY